MWILISVCTHTNQISGRAFKDVTNDIECF